MFTIAHVTDTHFGNRPAVRGRNERVVAAVVAANPDLVLVTGDVADHGSVEEYAEAREVFAPWTGPLLWLPGNHDVRDAFARHLLQVAPPADDGPILTAHDAGAVRLLLLDSLITAPEGKRIDHGELSETSLAWLSEELAASDKPTLVALHHPPVTIGVDFMDEIRLRDAEPLAGIVSAHDHILATLVGHTHGMTTTTFGGKPLLVGGAVSTTIPLRSEGYPRKLVRDLPPSYALHVIDEARLITHWRAL